MSEARTKFVAQLRVFHGPSEIKKDNGRLEPYRTCSLCNCEIAPDAGDVLFGEKWFHGLCWEVVERKID
ncbi:MAG: hypothetical protein JRN15_02125 [Nitrososphaerota archaeon]|nr:hypothetical protein [Nitrososphaerota archaeon]